MSPKVFEMQAALCQAMSYPARLELVHILRHGSMRLEDLAQAADANYASVSRHLTMLRNSGVVTAQRSGHEVVYELANPKIAVICDLMREVLTEQMAHDLAMIAPSPIED